MSTNTALNAFFQECYEKQRQITTHPLLKEIRQKAWDCFIKLDFPNKKRDGFHYLPLSHLYEKMLSQEEGISFPSNKTILSYVYPECSKSYLVFIDGVFIQELSCIETLPQKVIVLPLSQALPSYAPFFQSRWNKALKDENDPFVFLNYALHPEALFVCIPRNVRVESPVQLLSFSASSNHFSSPRVHLFIAPQGYIKLTTSTIGPGVHNSFLDITLEEGAECHYTDDKSESGSLTWSLSHLRASLKKKSRLNYLTYILGGCRAREGVKISLLEEETEASLNGLWNLYHQGQAHAHIQVDHIAPKSKSMQKFKSILYHTSQASLEGEITVQAEAQKTEAYQLSQNLLMGKGAIANVRPNLRIFADDVKASHGATTYHLDHEHLFYLRSRGLSLKTAEEVLLKAFVCEMIDLLPLPSMKQNLKNRAFSS